MNIRICFKITNTVPSKFICKRVESNKYEVEREEYKKVQAAYRKIVAFEEEVREEDVIPITLNEYLDHLGSGIYE